MLEGSASSGLLSHHRDQHPRCCSAHPGSLSGILVGGCPGTPSFCSAAPPRRPLPAASHFCTRRPPRTLSHVPILPCAAFPSFSSLRFVPSLLIFEKGPARPCRSLPQPERVHFHSFPAPRAPFRNLPFETARIQHLHTLPVTLLDCFCSPWPRREAAASPSTSLRLLEGNSRREPPVAPSGLTSLRPHPREVTSRPCLAPDSQRVPW